MSGEWVSFIGLALVILGATWARWRLGRRVKPKGPPKFVEIRGGRSGGLGDK